MSKINMTLILS